MSEPQNIPLCMDARMLDMPGGTGVARYARALKGALEELEPDLLLLADRKRLDRPGKVFLGPVRRYLRAWLPIRRKARQRDELIVAKDIFRLGQAYFNRHGRLMPVKVKGPPGIMHWTYPVPIRLVGWRNVYTVHDVIPLQAAGMSPIDPFRHRWLLSRIADHAAAIITVSDAARRDLLQQINVRASHVFDCSLSVEVAPAPAEMLPEGIGAGRYLLVCGTVERRKNIANILAAYRDAQVTMPLVIAGPDGLGSKLLAPAIEEIPGVIRLPYLPDEAMRALIAHARALVMPSLMEGFGLPVAEAMALDVPVVTSNEGALAETAGGAALAVNPRSVAEIAEAMRRVASDDALCATLTAAGRDNAKRFSRELFADGLDALHAHLIDQDD